jgi:hypothetical protein
MLRARLSSLCWGQEENPFFINNQGNRVEMFRIIRGVGDMLTFLDAADNPIQFGEGETMGNDVLMDQHGSLVYFAIQVNDVYPYFLTGVAGGTIQATQFPSSQQDMNNITSFAQAHAVTLSDPRHHDHGNKIGVGGNQRTGCKQIHHHGRDHTDLPYEFHDLEFHDLDH